MRAHEPHRTREPQAPEAHADHLRASDAERERTVDSLRVHAGAGRLDAEELEERIGKAFAARTRADLAAIVADLPGTRRVTESPRRHDHDHRTAPPPFVAIAVLLIAIWAVTGAGYFWPIWPLMWFAFAGLMRFRPGNTRVIR